MNKIQIIVLAAGHGKRMQNGELPKVLTLLKGKPLIVWLLDAIRQSGVCQQPLIVVGQKATLVKEALGSRYIYATQEEQLGTGHAVMAAKAELQGKVSDIMVLYGDHPSVTAPMIAKLADVHLHAQTVLTMATVIVPDFADWRSSFVDYGRIIRDSSGEIVQIVERKDATIEQQAITEVNPGYYCFKAEWLWQNLEKLQNNNVQHEYYLTDLVEMAKQQGYKIATVAIDPKTALGVNTPEQLNLVNQVL